MMEEDIFNNILLVISNKKTDNYTKIILIKALINGVFCNLYGKINHFFVKNIHVDTEGKFSDVEIAYDADSYRKTLIFPISHYGFTWFVDIEDVLD